MSATQRLGELGLVLPPVSSPLAAYVPAVRSGNLVFVSGQLPVADGALLRTGKVGEGGVSVADAKALAQRCALNGLAAAAAVGGGLDAITAVVKVVGYVACGADFTEHPEILNGASELLGSIFGEAGAHARVAVGVSSLPRDAPVEVEMIVAVAPV